MCNQTPQDREQVIRMLFQDVELARLTNESLNKDMAAQALRFQAQKSASSLVAFCLGMMITAVIIGAIEEERKNKETPKQA